MSAVEYLVGVAYLSVTVGALVAAAWLLTRRRLAHLPASVRVLSGAVIATLGLIAVHVVPLAFGLLARPTVLALAVLALAGVWLVPARRTQAEPPPPPVARSKRGSWLIAGVAIATVAIVELGQLYRTLPLPLGGADALAFHIPGVVRWIQHGSLWSIDQFIPHQAHGNYPHNGDVVLLASILPWSSDFLVRACFLPFLGLTGLGVYALARELRAPAACAALFGAVFVALPIASTEVFLRTNPDVVMYFAFATGVLFLLRHLRTRQTPDLVMAGAALGLALGTKWYGVSSVAAVVALWAVLLVRRRGASITGLLRRAAVLLSLIAATGGVWLVRNLVESGNPVFPVKVAPLGITIFDAPRDLLRERGGFTIADYLTDVSVWNQYLVPSFGIALGVPGLVIFAGFLLAAAIALAEQTRRRKGARVVLRAAVAVVVLAGVYVITPYSAFGPKGAPIQTAANARYVGPALLVAAALAAWGTGRLRRLRPLAEVLALLSVVSALAAAFGPRLTLASLALASLGGGAVAVSLSLLRRRAAKRDHEAMPRARGRAPLAVAAAFAVVLLLAAVAYGWVDQRRYSAGRFRGMDAAITWVDARAPSGHRVGLAGTWGSKLPPVLAMFGPRYGNHVAYVGPWDGGMLSQYRGPAAFGRALRRGRFDLLLVGRGSPPRQEVREERWARLAGYVPVARSELFTLFQAPGAGAQPPAQAPGVTR